MRKPLGKGLLPIAILVLSAGAARADLIFFKDGFVIEGITVREGKSIFEAGQSIWIPQGFWYADDFVRRMYFSPLQVHRPSEKEYKQKGEIRWKGKITYYEKTPWMPPMRDLAELEDWNDKWEKRVKVRTLQTDKAAPRDITVTLQLNQLNPHFARADSWVDARGLPSHRFFVYYSTQELGPAKVRALLTSHPDWKITKDLKEEEVLNRRFKLFNFFIEAGWYVEAEQELEQIYRDIPTSRDKVESSRVVLRRLRGQQLFDEITRAHAAGQHQAVLNRLAAFSEEGIEEKLLLEFRDLRASYESAKAKLESVKRYLSELPNEVQAPAQKQLLSEAAAAIRDEVGMEDFLPPARESMRGRVGRLEVFLILAKQAETQRKAGREPLHSATQLLSVAVCSWLLGNGSAEDRYEAAQRLWQARKLVLEYQRTENARGREQLLAEYQKGGSSTVPVDEMAHLIGFLPPPDPEMKPAGVTVEMRVGARGRGIPYLLRLPPEYSHSRTSGYPVLFVLSDGTQKPKEMLDRWADLAAQHGYILVAPDWRQGLTSEYGYSSEEHRAVLDVLRQLRQSFQVDSDRVFLFGYGEGGFMAYDVGLSHPDLFAGVLPMTAYPQWYSKRYWPNAQNLPFYVVGGDWCTDGYTENRAQFEKWIPRGYPMMYVIYRGRGMEWFGTEMPQMIDWMNRKLRANPTRQVGTPSGAVGAEFCTFRASDNRFYWLSTDGVLPSSQIAGIGRDWRNTVYPATLQGRISEGNHLALITHGVNQVTVWFGRGSMIDFDQPVTVYLNSRQVAFKKVVPSLEVLLEDLYQRGDRQCLYSAKLSFKP